MCHLNLYFYNNNNNNNISYHHRHLYSTAVIIFSKLSAFGF